MTTKTKTKAATAHTLRLRGPRPAEISIGHNSGLPVPVAQSHLIHHAPEAMAELRDFLANFPVIESEEDHKKGSGFLERSRAALAGLDAEEKSHTAPLRSKLEAIYERYRSVRRPFADALSVLRDRLNRYIRAEEARRQAAAEKARREAEEAERIAWEAKRDAENAMAEADVGVLTDPAAAILDAHNTHNAFQRADRKARIAEKSVPVRAPSMLGNRAITARSYEVLTVTNPCAALEAMGLSPVLEEAFKTAAREYRTAHGELPPGIQSHFERRI